MLQRILIGLIRFYQVAVSPWTPASCRFQPTCSTYARQAIERYGALKGSGLAVRRLLRCHPWGGMGYDPVPPRQGAPSGGRVGHGDRETGEPPGTPGAEGRGAGAADETTREAPRPVRDGDR